MSESADTRPQTLPVPRAASLLTRIGGGVARLGEAALAPVARAAVSAERVPEPEPEPGVLRLVDVVKEYVTPIGRKRVLDGIGFELRKGEKIGVLGRNGAGKSTLVRLLGGVEPPTRGRVERGLYMSWPLGFSGGVDGRMTGMDNIRFISRLYGKRPEDVAAFVDDFAELGRYLYVPVAHYSSGMQMRLSFGITLAIDFDCFLIDEVIAVGDQRFHRKCHEQLFVNRAHCAMVLVTHDIHALRNYCQRVIILKGGRARVFDDIDLALSIYASL